MTAPKAAASSGQADAHTLATLFPASLGAWKLSELGQPQSPPQAPAPQPLMRALYTQGAQSVEFSVRSGRPGSMAKGQRDVYREGPPQNELSMVVVSLANGVSIAATSRSADAAALEAMIRSLDLARAETLQPVKR